MKIGGKVWKSRKDKFWLVEIPFLDLMTQTEHKEDIPDMVKDAIELLVDDSKFKIEATLDRNVVLVESNNPKKLLALILKRQRLKNNLKLEEVSSQLKAKSINEYAQYEQGKHLPSLEQFEKLLKAIDPHLMPFMSVR